jgi:NAD(P)-dependent dehydrogenase (short-subunit alcohol dehydrogenase family)
VVKEIETTGGEAVAVAEDVSTMAGGERIVNTALERWGRVDGVVAVAGILRERMLFNMSEDEWDAVIATHLKGHFTVFRHAAAVMRKQESGSLIGFTSGAFVGSVAQANYSSAKGGIVSLVRSAAVGLHRYGVRANAVAPVARTRMSANVPMELAEMGEPEDVAPLVVYLLSDAAKDVTGQVYTAVGGRIAVWNQPVEVREMRTEGRWTPEEIAERFDEVGQERMGLIDRLEQIRRAATSGDKPNA